MLYGARARRGAAAAGLTAFTSLRPVNTGAKEIVNELISKVQAYSSPPKFAQELRDDSQPKQRGNIATCTYLHGFETRTGYPNFGMLPAGLYGQYAWVAKNPVKPGESVRISWWKYGREGCSQEGTINLIDTQSVGDIRAVVFYYAPFRAQGEILSLAVADSAGLAIHRIEGPNHSFREDWDGLKLKGGDNTVLEAQPGGYLLGCNNSQVLFFLRDVGAKDGKDLGEWIEHATAPPHFFQRFLGNVFQSGNSAGADVRDIVVSRRGAGFGQEFDVYVMTPGEVHKWQLTAGDDNSMAADQKVRSRQFEGGGRLVGLQVQRACGADGRWTDARLVLLAANPDSCSLTVSFLSLLDLSTLRSESLPAIPGLWDGTSSTDDLRLLPLTAPAPRAGPTAGLPSDVPNLHVTDGQQLFSTKLHGRLLNNQLREWFPGPAGRPCGWQQLEEEGRWQTEILLLFPEGVFILQPADEEEEEPGARSAFDDGGLIQVLRSSTDERPEAIVDKIARCPAVRDRLGGLEQRWRASAAGAASRRVDRGELSCVAAVEAIQALTLDRPMDLGGGGSQGEALDRQACGQFLKETDRRLTEYTRAAGAFVRGRPELLEAGLRALQERARAARALLEEEQAAVGGPRLAPETLLSDAIEAAVARWEGANRLRPWSAAWRTFCGRVSTVEDVLWAACECLRRRVDDLRAKGGELEQVWRSAAWFFLSSAGILSLDIALSAVWSVRQVELRSLNKDQMKAGLTKLCR